MICKICKYFIIDCIDNPCRSCVDNSNFKLSKQGEKVLEKIEVNEDELWKELNNK